MLPQWGPLRTKSYQGRGGSSAVAATDRAICVAKPINTRTACSCRAARYGLTTTGTGAGWVGSKMLSSVLGGAIAVHLLLPFSSVAALSPYEEAKQLVYGPTADGRVRACPSNVNPNCVSTGSINDTYSPAWRAIESSPAAAAQVLEQAVTGSLQGSRLLKSMSLKSGAEYRAFGVQSLFGEDVLEFLIKPESVTDRNWEGDAAGQLVTYRSMAGSVKYIWPIQQPVSDFDTQRKRLKLLRDDIGWPIIGCELLECYQ